MARRLSTFALFAAMVVCVPRSSDAAFLDFIWGLSGPQLIGVGVGCRFDFHGKRDICEVGATPAMMSLEGRDLWSRLFVSVGGTGFVSTAKNSGTNVDYRWGDVAALAFEPSVSFNSVDRAGVRLYHGIGPTYGYFFGVRRDFQSFDKFGIRVTPVEVVFHDQRAVLALTLRLFPNGFTDDEFGVGERRDFNRPFESVIGLSFGYTF